MNITEYVEKFGHLSFDEAPFNEADSLVMAQMAYLNWDLILPKVGTEDKHFKLFKNVPDKLNVALNAGEFDSKKSEKLFLLMKKSKRFGESKARFVSRIDDLEKHTQFFALTITLPNGLDVISFRGTDLTLNGWIEDTMLCFEDEIPSQREAVDYVDKVTSVLRGPFIMVGHSKGGNLSYYAAMMMKKAHKERLINAYSFDGPGFFSEQIYKTEEYAESRKKMIKYIPVDSVVGMMLNHDDNVQVVDSINVGVFQHDPFSWTIKNDCTFLRRQKRFLSSQINEKALVNFLDTLTLEERKEISGTLFGLMGSPDQSLIYLVKHLPKTTKHFIKTLSSYSKAERKQLTALVFKLMGSYLKVFKNALTYKKN